LLTLLVRALPFRSTLNQRFEDKPAQLCFICATHHNFLVLSFTGCWNAHYINKQFLQSLGIKKRFRLLPLLQSIAMKCIFESNNGCPFAFVKEKGTALLLSPLRQQWMLSEKHFVD
jgi:hypothetical protein